MNHNGLLDKENYDHGTVKKACILARMYNGPNLQPLLSEMIAGLLIPKRYQSVSVEFGHGDFAIEHADWHEKAQQGQEYEASYELETNY